MNRALLLLLVGALALLGLPGAATADDGDFTVQWSQLIEVVEQPQPVMSIGPTAVTLRPIQTKKENDTPRAALFVGKARATSTPLFPGKRYHFTLVHSDGTAQWYLNGFPNGSSDLEARIDEVSMPSEAQDTARLPRALSDAEVLASFKALVQPRAIATVAHRGIHRYAPENTRISYVQAVEAGAPIVEIDTALTRDGHIILMHDKTVDRTTDGTGKVAELTLEEIRKLDAGSWKDPKYKGEPVPTLDEIAEVVRGKATIMFDLKAEGQGEAIARWLEKSGFPEDQVILAPWTDEEGVALRQHVKNVPMVRLTGKVPTDNFDDAYFAQMREKGFSGFSISWQSLTEPFLEAAQRNGMKIYAWTINAPSEIAGAVRLGVDGVVTDDSAATRKTIAQLVSPLDPQDVR